MHDANAVATEAAKRVVAIAQTAVKSKDCFTVALAGGSTPKSLYLLLADEPFRSQIAWEQTEIYWGDERAVPPDHPDSNYRMAHEALLQFVPIPEENIHRIHAELATPNAAQLYDELLTSRFGAVAEERPTFDLVLLGLGEDGHTASLFPDSEAIFDLEHLARAIDHPERGPRVTLTPPAINRAAHVIFLVTGRGKADALSQTLHGEKDILIHPAQIIDPPSGTVTWLVDQAAAFTLHSHN